MFPTTNIWVSTSSKTCHSVITFIRKSPKLPHLLEFCDATWGVAHRMSRQKYALLLSDLSLNMPLLPGTPYHQQQMWQSENVQRQIYPWRRSHINHNVFEKHRNSSTCIRTTYVPLKNYVKFTMLLWNGVLWFISCKLYISLSRILAVLPPRTGTLTHKYE